MIESAFGYKFRDHISETILYEDQIVEHVLTGYIAQRRVFPKRLLQDETAFLAVKDQVRLASSISHPNVPSIINAGLKDEQYLIIQQKFQGENLELISQRKHANTPKDWAQIAKRLVRLLNSLQLNGIAFDRIHLRDIVYNNQLILVSSRYPVGKTGPEALEKSPFLQRLFESNTSGIYHVQGRFPVEECLSTAKNLLFQLACSRQYETVDAAHSVQVERMRTSGQHKVYSALGIESSIEEIIMRIHNQTDANAIRSLDELSVVLDKFDPVKVVHSTIPMGMKQIPESELKNEHQFAQDFGSETNTPKSSSKTGLKAVSGPTSPAKPVQQVVVVPKHLPESDYAPSTGGTRQMVGTPSVDDVEEDRSYLYPTAQTSGSSSSSEVRKSKERISTEVNTTNNQKSSKSLPVVPIIIGVVVIALIGIGVVMLPVLMKKENTAPKAMIEAADGTITKMTVPLKISGKGSSDPDENTTLAYTWSLSSPNLDATDYIIKPTDSSGSEITVSIFKQGTFPLELVVFDGSLKSVPERISITVEANN